MDKKYGAYICTGCGIGDALDIAALTSAAGENGMQAKTHEALCSAAGRELIQNDITNDGVNTIVVCACSPRVMKDEEFCRQWDRWAQPDAPSSCW